MKKQTGAVILAELLKAYGITHIFMVPAVLRRTMVEIEKKTKKKIKVIDLRWLAPINYEELFRNIKKCKNIFFAYHFYHFP